MKNWLAACLMGTALLGFTVPVVGYAQEQEAMETCRQQAKEEGITQEEMAAYLEECVAAMTSESGEPAEPQQEGQPKPE